jgi:hypothetical protein
MNERIDEMWAAFEAHEPEPSYADAWATMCRERTVASASTVTKIATLPQAVNAASFVVLAIWSVSSSYHTEFAWARNYYICCAIDAIKGVESRPLTESELKKLKKSYDIYDQKRSLAKLERELNQMRVELRKRRETLNASRWESETVRNTVTEVL